MFGILSAVLAFWFLYCSVVRVSFVFDAFYAHLLESVTKKKYLNKLSTFILENFYHFFFNHTHSVINKPSHHLPEPLISLD